MPDVEEFLRPDLYEEEIEAAMRKVDQHRLIGRERTPIPAQPRRQIVDAERDRHHQPFETPEITAGALWEDLLAGCIERLAVARGVHRLRFQPFYIGLAHDGILLFLDA
jgi:hypothetical protein